MATRTRAQSLGRRRCARPSSTTISRNASETVSARASTKCAAPLKSLRPITARKLGMLDDLGLDHFGVNATGNANPKPNGAGGHPPPLPGFAAVSLGGPLRIRLPGLRLPCLGTWL